MAPAIRSRNSSSDAKPMAKEPKLKGGGELVPQEIWRIKDKLSAARGQDVHRLFADARQRQKHFGHPVAILRTKRQKV